MDLSKYTFNSYGKCYCPERINDRWYLVNPETRFIVVIEGGWNIDNLCEKCNIPDDVKLLMKLIYGE